MNPTLAIPFVLRVALGLCLFLLLAAPGCQPYQFEWQGPTPYFDNALDANKDGELTRAEWELFNWGTNLTHSTGSVREFLLADCDQNGRYSWPEYFRHRFKGENCAENGPLYAQVRAQADFGKSYGEYLFPALFTGHQMQGLATATSPSFFAALQPVLALMPAAMHEIPLTPTEQTAIGFNCAMTQETVMPLQIGALTAGSYPSALCNIENTLSTTALTFLLMEIKENAHASLHAKAIWIPPRSSEQLIVLFPVRSTPESVEIRSMGGMPF